MTIRPFITLDQVTVRIGGTWILDQLSWQINRGENWVLWGPNGAGKSTVAKAILGQVAVVRGRVRRHYERPDGEDLNRTPVALVSPDQQTDLFRNERMLAMMRDFSHQTDAVTRVREVFPGGGDPHPSMALLNIEPLLEKPLQSLSAGEMRRLLIGRALLQQPRMLILDEPFNGLDQTTRQTLIDLFGRMAAAGTQMVLITHRVGDIPPSFSHVLHLAGGRTTWKGPLKDFAPLRAAGKHPGRPAPVVSGKRHGVERPDGERARAAAMIQMRHVSVRYGPHQVLTDIDWTVREGENWALIGPNGAGKSTLLKLITGDNLQGYANNLVLFGHPKGTGESIWQIKAHIGYVADDLQLRHHKAMSGFDVVCSGFFDSVGLYRHCTDDQRQAAWSWIAKTGIGDLAGQRFTRLSFGQQRMVLIARAMVKGPRLLILDEPCNGLDRENRVQLLEILDIVGCTGTASLLYVSHRPDEMPQCITHRLFIDGGRIVSST